MEIKTFRQHPLVVKIVEAKNSFTERQATRKQAAKKPMSEKVSIKKPVDQKPAPTVGPLIEEFSAIGKFIVGTGRNKEVKIACVGGCFRRHYLTKIEDVFPRERIIFKELPSAMTKDQILEIIGGVEKAALSLFDLWTKLKIQKDGRKGTLLTNGEKNLFFITDLDGDLHIVWTSFICGWQIGMNPDDKIVYPEGSKVFFEK